MKNETTENRNAESECIRGILFTVGGTPEPLIHCIREVTPAYAVLVCSNDSISTATAVKEALANGGLENISVHHVVVQYPDNLVESHRKIAEGLRYLRQECGLETQQIRIDFTGGTKAMSAAAVLAAAPEGYRFLYVSGKRRNKSGIGTVEPGFERLLHTENPWSILEEPELRRMLVFAGMGEWTAAQKSATDLLVKAEDSSKPLFQCLNSAIHGLGDWDDFKHREAWRKWQKGLIPRKLKELAQVSECSLLVNFAQKCLGLIGYLEKVAEYGNRQIKKDIDFLVLDLLANGQRQANRGHYDEAALRYYRAIELCVARRLHFLYGIDNSKVKKSEVPAALRGEFEKQKGTVLATLKLAQYDSIRLLAAKGDKIGQRLENHYEKLDTTARNENWLIHGWQHVDDKRFQSFRKEVINALGLEESQIPLWPDFGI